MDLDEDVTGNDSSDEVSRLMHQCAKDYDIEIEPLSCLDDRKSDVCRKLGSFPAASDNMDCRDTYPNDKSMMDLGSSSNGGYP